MQNNNPGAGSKRARGIQTPIIPTINQLVRSTPGTISLGQGISYYGPPESAYAEVKKQLASDEINRYGPTHGIDALQDALAIKLQKKNNICLNQDMRIFVTAGSNMAFSSIIASIADPGDEVILLTPYYFNHETALHMTNVNAVLVATREDYHPDLEAIKKAITTKTKAVVTVSPNNPTGAVYTQTELAAINTLCAEHGIYHISDEAYEDFLHDGAKHFSPAAISGASAHTISIFSFSKAYGFAGWRMGYMLIPKALFDTMTKVQDTVLISPPIISQFAAVGALRAPGEYLAEKLAEISRSRDVCMSILEPLDSLDRTARSEGAFYIFAKLKTTSNDVTIAKRLISEHGIATIPGSAFGIQDGAYLRISYGAITGDAVKNGINKLATGLQQLL